MNEAVFVPFPVSRVLALLRKVERYRCCVTSVAYPQVNGEVVHASDCELAAIKAELERQVQS